MNTTDNINYFSDKGKVFSRKSDGLIMGYGIGLGKNDSIDNYIEIDCPEELKGVEGCDNDIVDE